MLIKIPEREFASFAMPKRSDNDINFLAFLANGIRNNLQFEYGYCKGQGLNILACEVEVNIPLPSLNLMCYDQRCPSVERLLRVGSICS